MSAPVLPDHQIEVPAVLLPDRADAPISEITERFFRALLTKVPLERIEEVHLFSPLRSGGVETGIAVIAARELVVAPAVIDEPLPLPLDAADVVIVPVETVLAEHGVVDDIVTEDASTEDASAEDAPGEILVDSPYADDDQTAEFVVATGKSTDDDAVLPSDGVAPLDAEPALPPATVVRHTVYTARYRLVQKGPERGKWESNVVAEAEAPLITVETVVRGVQRRAGEESETTRFSAAQLARALRIELPASA
jgi:hypothetical protein